MVLRDKYDFIIFWQERQNKRISDIWRPPRLSDLAPMIFYSGLTHLGFGGLHIILAFIMWVLTRSLPKLVVK